MKKEMEEDTRFTLQLLLAVLFHPLAVVMVWVNLAQRSDLGPRMKTFWVCASFVWIFGPLSYISMGRGKFW